MSELTPNETIDAMMEILTVEYEKWHAPIVTFVANTRKSPFLVLVSTVLSLRTKDETTAAASERLFAKVAAPEDMLCLSAAEIERLIYPVGFYRTKARNLLEISRILIDRYGGAVPDTIEELLTLPGVGRKTANLVVVLGFGKPGMCVDTHVHRISNRWGYVRTKTPEQTEFALREKLPLKWWMRYNDVLVAMGQTICKPISPLCSKCPVEKFCPKINVDKHR